MSEIKVNKISPKQNCTQVTLGDSGDDFVVASGVNFKTAAVKDSAGNVIVSRCGSNITIGSCGASIALACGASQTGFGRTGTVNWDTTAKTASFTAVSGNGYFVNTTSGAVTMTLPSTPSAGDIVSVKDYAYTFETNNLTVNRNGSPIGGGTDTNTIVYSTNGDFLTFIYVDGTRGWVLTNDSTNTDETGAQFIVATGGTVTCCGDYKIHTFTGPGTFCVSCAGNAGGSNTVDYLVVAGGGGGGNGCGGGGAGAGGFRESKAACAPWTASPLATCVSLPVTATGYPITVGGGGATSPSDTGSSGADSVFSTITSAGGGGGGKENTTPRDGVSGGSGGGGGGSGTPFGGSGNTPPVSPPQGNDGGDGSGPAPYVGGSGGGGGGASAAGNAGSGTGSTPPAPSSVGGDGHGTAINNIACVGTPGPTPGIRYFAGGGSGATSQNHPGTPAPATFKGPSAGGGGGGGKSCYPSPGTTNTGGGGGGGNGGAPGQAGTGGSGIVIIRYKYQ